MRDRDPIRAIIRGSGLNQDGRTPGITLPSGIAQEALISHVYKSAGLDPAATEFVEAHGTGTQAGDPIETGALAKVFCQNRDSMQPLRVGSIKTNVGHLEGTSGVAGVIKAILMLENGTFLPSRGFTSLNPRILIDDWKIKVSAQVVENCFLLITRNIRYNSFPSPGRQRVLTASLSIASVTGVAMHTLL